MFVSNLRIRFNTVKTIFKVAEYLRADRFSIIQSRVLFKKSSDMEYNYETRHKLQYLFKCPQCFLNFTKKKHK